MQPLRARAPPDLLDAGQPWALKKKTTDEADRRRLKKLLYFIFVTICVGGCLFQVISLLTLYFAYPSVVGVSMVPADRLTLPGITLCNSNSVTLSNLKVFSKNLTDEKLKNFDQEFQSLNDSGGAEMIQKKQTLIDQCLRELMKMPIKETVNQGPSFEQFVIKDRMECAFDRNESSANNTCKNMADPLATSQQIGNCFTLFHESKGRDVNKVSISPGYGQSPIVYGNSSDSLRVEVSDQKFQPNEVIRMRLNFAPDEYTSLNDPVYGTISIHDPSECPDTRKRRYYIYPGNYYEFYITKKESRLLPAPYKTKCFDYVESNKKYYIQNDTAFKSGAQKAHPYLDHPLSRDDCKIGCLAKKAIRNSNCSCWPPELPFIGGFEDRKIKSGGTEQLEKQDSFETMLACDWIRMGSSGTFANYTEAYEQCFADHDEECERNCPKDCLITSFDVAIQSFEWPDSNRIEGSGEKRKAELLALRNTTAVVSIRYWTSDMIKNDHAKKFEPIEFVSYVGGLVSMYMGFSFLGFYDIVVDWIIAVKDRFAAWKEKRGLAKNAANHSRSMNQWT